MDDTISSYVNATLYGTVDLHPTLGTAGTLSNSLPGVLWTTTNSLDVGTTLIGTWFDVSAVDGVLNSGQRTLHWHSSYEGNGNPVITHYVEYVTVSNDVTNVWATSSVLLAPEDISPNNAFAHMGSNAIASATMYQGVRLYVTRSGGSSATYYCYGGTENYDSKLTGRDASSGTFQPYDPDLNDVPGLIADATNVVMDEVQATNTVLQNQIDAIGGGSEVYTNQSMIRDCWVHWSDTDTVVITNGEFMANGVYYSIETAITYDMTTLASGSDFHYIYASSAGSSGTNVIIYDSTVEPVKSETLFGWYNGNTNADRCLGALLSTNGAATIPQFSRFRDEVFHAGNVGQFQLAANMNPDGTWQTPATRDTDGLTPVFASHVRIRGLGADANSSCQFLVIAKEYTDWATDGPATYGALGLLAGYIRANPFGLLVPLGPSRQIRIRGIDDDDNSLGAHFAGWTERER